MSDESPLEVHFDVDLDFVSILRARGEIDLGTVALLRQSFEGLGARSLPVVIDLREVTFLDSSGLRELEEACSTSEACAMVVAGDSIVMRVLELTGLKEQFVVFQELEDAVNHFRNSQ